MKTIIVAVAAGGVLLTGCGGSSGGQSPAPLEQQAPITKDFTQVTVDGDKTVDVTKTELYGYTCLVGVESTWYHDYSPAIWCDPSSAPSPSPEAIP